ncbi:E3 SUMO-protein ligase ZNF451 isoform X2 [Clupea harengus]|nr:E3 SUMO-protein ligase ZNF451 isoform X2 [Clupea harengus]XP_031434995.1 E3 SUMO-protein ligase ZNF451 isoform X2 [Clupea harengus]XP_031434996.1 E3 SUMO-protein ligase ZNF451 isoform X2 [Clupea harengus]XP_031434997.1 E3 SUMO-protein ligase ZNF451 isoform X2 [Clupea harengus]XP_031434998.1 E3 SUMO-protein ligase ZNF451 isoform X2 [Clupea harengus]
MSSDVVDVDDEDVEFVSEGPLRPVVDFIDLSSDDDGDDNKTPPETTEDEVDKHKAQVTSTLDRLARQVAAEKQERADKCKAFKRKVISQQAHGRQELAVSHNNGETYDAKRCVDMWLKMPGVKPGVINSGTGWRRQSAASAAMFKSSPQTCPVVNCGRVYENKALLEGHLIRFDHSPCDPNISLKGHPSVLYACVACGWHFDTKDSWRAHQLSKMTSSNPGSHGSSQTCQQIVCFACPSCCLLFNIRDECLQHMAEKDHFSECIKGFASKSVATPIPVPRYAKNRLIALCKEVGFSVRCSGCQKRLPSHMEARAHFNVNCRNATAVAVAEQNVAEVMQLLIMQGRCTICPTIFHNQDQIEEHKQQTQHTVELTGSMEKAILHYSDFQERQISNRAPAATSSPGPSKRALGQTDSPRLRGSQFSIGSPAKRKRPGTIHDNGKSGCGMTTVWYCECSLRFPAEALASKHLLAANQIFHKCGVCGKLMGESSITRLHMSRFHGGAHLSNFLLHCRKCRVDMPRMEDIMAHVGTTHQGHTFYQEKEEEVTASAPSADPSAKASTSTGGPGTGPGPRQASPKKQKWLCRMCEDLFDSEAAAAEHCGDLTAHSFQKFACAHCPQKFFKEATLRRHCHMEHEGQEATTRFFCGLCDSMLYDTEHDFLQHYNSIHSKDYYCLEAAQPSTSTASQQASDQLVTTETDANPDLDRLCPCMSADLPKDQAKATYTKCMKQLANAQECSYSCSLCDEQVLSYAQIKTHVHTKHGVLKQAKAFMVVCGACSEKHEAVPAFHSHYHSQHCPLEPCVSSRSCDQRAEASTSTKILHAEEICPEKHGKCLSTTDIHMEECEDVKQVMSMVSSVKEDKKSEEDESDEDLKRALALSEEESKKPTVFDNEMEEALRRSLEEF